MKVGFQAAWTILATFSLGAIAAAQDLAPLKYNHPGLVVDLWITTAMATMTWSCGHLGVADARSVELHP